MLRLFRTIGAAVVLGVGARAGSELFDVLKRHARKRRHEDAASAEVEHPPIRPEEAGEEDIDAAEERLKAERERINRELERLRRKRARQGS